MQQSVFGLNTSTSTSTSTSTDSTDSTNNNTRKGLTVKLISNEDLDSRVITRNELIRQAKAANELSAILTTISKHSIIINAAKEECKCKVVSGQKTVGCNSCYAKNITRAGKLGIFHDVPLHGESTDA